jgi:microcystin-dependent protein
MTPYLGQIMMFGGNFAPVGFAFCNGQLLNISQNAALFALLGKAYGGNGVQTFGLPNLQSRLPVSQGSGPGLSSYALGQIGGADNVTITTSTMPSHQHLLNATKTIATTATIGNTVLPGQPTVATPPNSPSFYAAQGPGQPALIPHTLAAGTVSSTGGSQPHTNLMPSLCITFVIALTGLFPSRS